MPALRECGTALRFVPAPLRRDREVVLAAVQNDGEALIYAPPELQARSSKHPLACKRGENGVTVDVYSF